jgi:hypothetical protein
MFDELFSRIGSCLKQHSIPYMITGSQAFLLYGKPRLVRDIDIIIGLDARCTNLLLSILQEMALLPVPDDPKAFVKQTMVLPALDEPTGVRVDFIISSSAYEEQALKRVRRVRLNDHPLCFASPEDVIIHRVLVGQFGDQEDVRSILVSHLNNLDLPYIRRWLREFEAASGKGTFLLSFEGVLRQVRDLSSPGNTCR